jgi:hypothetical protein
MFEATVELCMIFTCRWMCDQGAKRFSQCQQLDRSVIIVDAWKIAVPYLIQFGSVHISHPLFKQTVKLCYDNIYEGHQKIPGIVKKNYVKYSYKFLTSVTFKARSP